MVARKEMKELVDVAGELATLMEHARLGNVKNFKPEDRTRFGTALTTFTLNKAKWLSVIEQSELKYSTLCVEIYASDFDANDLIPPVSDKLLQIWM